MDVDVDELLNGGSLSTGDIANSNMKGLMDEIMKITKNIVLPIIWAVLGLFLIIKGSILGFQIVKAADEPQVRQEKIHSLKWLVIGVAIAALSGVVVRVVIGFFEGAF